MSDDLTPEIAAAIAQERWADVMHVSLDGYSSLELVQEAARVLAAENERLKAWKAEATEVLKGWNGVWVAMGSPGALGTSTHGGALAWVTDTRAACGGLSPEAVEWAIRIGIAYTRVVYDDTEANNHAVIAAYQLCPPEVRAQITGAGQ